jgi:phenylacetic acid degradation operon negative regulatory protein
MSALQDNCAEILRRFRQRPDTSARTLLVTVFGDSIEPHGGEVWLGSLAGLVAPLGISERLVRTSLNRLVGEGLLAPRRIGRRSFYSVTPTAHHEFWSVEDRIYQRHRRPWDGRWTILVETNGMGGGARADLRQRLGWLGFASLSPGVQLCPTDRTADLEVLLDELHLTGQVAVFRGEADAGLGLADLRLAQRTSDLDALEPSYQAFLRHFGRAAQATGEAVPETAFLVRTLLVHAYRRIALREPELPAGLWPDAWIGDEAYDLAARLYHALDPAAEAHLDATCETPAGPMPTLDHSYRERFGGRQMGSLSSTADTQRRSKGANHDS